MYNAQTTKDRIKLLCKSKKISMEDLLVSCNLGINAVRQINDTKGMASFSLARIADYLDCSVDYLLGRTDCPEIARSGTSAIKIAAKGRDEHVIELEPEQITALKQALAQLPND